MARPLKLETLAVWQLACQFEDGVLELLARSPSVRRDFKLYTQLSEAASSVASNVSEGFNRYNAREFAHFIRYSRGSLGEAERRLHSGVKKGYWPQSATTPLHAIAGQLGPALNGFRLYLLRAADRKNPRPKRRPHRDPG